MVLTKQTYNNQDKYKKPKDIHKKPQKLQQPEYTQTHTHTTYEINNRDFNDFKLLKS